MRHAKALSCSRKQRNGGFEQYGPSGFQPKHALLSSSGKARWIENDEVIRFASRDHSTHEVNGVGAQQPM
jgi:hypothetical protein